ncbi:hypothetical protein [Nocardia macrotermitis]|uniref:Uncharacterized protein n=1 Tax=Nocardia macrotermitis TaxID=2585198 RepID=A0A7K0CXP3_9NOCA|nr:hypothetical protein [Nocardia macrotermitis]MQY18193.1 hypothetical protein [Nocardia macrotermitis]
MGIPQIDFGNAEIKALNEAVANGSFSITAEAAHEAKHQYDVMLTEIARVRQQVNRATHVTGFGGFQSAQELQAGFANKATDGVAVVDQLSDAVRQVQIAYLRAGKQFEEADQVNADRLRRLANTTQDNGDAS